MEILIPVQLSFNFFVNKERLNEPEYDKFANSHAVVIAPA